jgi:hypothetical protein
MKIGSKEEMKQVFSKKGVKYIEIDNFFKYNVEEFLMRFFSEKENVFSLEKIFFTGIFASDRLLHIIQSAPCPNLHTLDLSECPKLSTFELD